MLDVDENAHLFISDIYHSDVHGEKVIWFTNEHGKRLGYFRYEALVIALDDDGNLDSLSSDFYAFKYIGTLTDEDMFQYHLSGKICI